MVELVVLRIWNRVDPRITNRKIPSSHGPTGEDSSFFYMVGEVLVGVMTYQDWLDDAFGS